MQSDHSRWGVVIGCSVPAPKGAASSSMAYTMDEMAKANDLNIYKYLTYILAKRPNETMSDEQLEQLAPWSKAAKASCQN